MKTLRIPFTILCVLAFSALSTHAAQLASAKVLKVDGTVTKYSADGKQSPLKSGEILTQGDSISATALSSAMLVFSNGTEITVKENTSLNIAKLEQSPFGGGQSYEQLQADPSQSQALLELNYGEVGFHVKKLQPGSSFDIETPLGTAAIRGTQGSVQLTYNAQIEVFTLKIKNNDGLVDILSKYNGGLSYGNGNTASTGYNSNSKVKPHKIPQGNTVVIRLTRGDKLFDDLIAAYEQYIPPTTPKPRILQLPDPIFTPEDPGVIIVSPEDGDSMSETNGNGNGGQGGSNLDIIAVGPEN